MVELVKDFTSGRKGQQPAGVGTAPDVEDPTRARDASRRYRRNCRLGRICHRGAVSYREVRSTDNFHVVTDVSRVSVHVDRISPLRRRPEGSVRVSPLRICALNLAGARDRLTRRLRCHFGAERPAGDAAVVVTVPLGQS